MYIYKHTHTQIHTILYTNSHDSLCPDVHVFHSHVHACMRTHKCMNTYIHTTHTVDGCRLQTSQITLSQVCIWLGGHQSRPAGSKSWVCLQRMYLGCMLCIWPRAGKLSEYMHEDVCLDVYDWYLVWWYESGCVSDSKRFVGCDLYVFGWGIPKQVTALVTNLVTALVTNLFTALVTALVTNLVTALVTNLVTALVTNLVTAVVKALFTALVTHLRHAADDSSGASYQLLCAYARVFECMYSKLPACKLACIQYIYW
jgi:hypothetical protein